MTITQTYTDCGAITDAQRRFFKTGATLPVKYRLEALRRLKKGLRDNEKAIEDALYADLRKSPAESYMTEIGLVHEELSHIIKHLKRWARPRRVRTPLAHFHSKSLRIPEPYGVALIISPWNYPVQLSLMPLIGAVCAGNCAVLKPSAYAPHTSAALAKLVSECFSPEHAAVVEGGRDQNSELLETPFDYIFFTGSTAVGKLVAESAAGRFTPVSLELGGKSPVIVDETADIKVAARRIAFGKALNAGQTCVAPDYVLVQKDVKERLIRELAAAFGEFFKDGNYDDLPCIINGRHFERLCGLMQDGKIVYGGGTVPEKRLITPTILDSVSPDDAVMKEEIFGPVLPVLTYEYLDEAIEFIEVRPKPLALYIFTRSRQAKDTVISSLRFGGGCVNDCVVHTASPYLPFGGIGESGTGSYHGRQSFDTFSHYKSILRKSGFPDLRMRCHPYSARKDAIIRYLLR